MPLSLEAATSYQKEGRPSDHQIAIGGLAMIVKRKLQKVDISMLF